MIKQKIEHEEIESLRNNLQEAWESLLEVLDKKKKDYDMRNQVTFSLIMTIKIPYFAMWLKFYI